MKKTFLLALLLSFTSIFASAQCTYINGDFEDWQTFPLEFNNVERNIETPTEHISTVRFFITFFLIEFIGDPYTFDMFQNDPVTFWGMEKSTDASSGQYAVKLKNDPEINVCDIYTNHACSEIADIAKIDIKHVGTSADTLYIFGAYDENLPPLQTDQAALDTLAGYFLDSIIMDGNVDYTTFTYPIHVNDPNFPVDTFSLLIFTTTNNDNYFLVDNIRFESVTDDDGDGFASDVDCDDTNASVNPGATEICNGIDDNCDGQVDEGLLTTYYLDSDGDGFGDLTMSQLACSPPADYVLIGGDCDDNNPDVNADATEVCNGIDDNCNTQIDEGLLSTYFFDADGDGFGSPLTSIQACSAPVDYVDNADDCNDNNENEFPGQIWYADADGDGYGDGTSLAACLRPADYYLEDELTATTGDCDETNEAIYPDAVETCDGVDNDCNGTIDDNITYQDYFLDADGDGFGTGTALNDCQSPGTDYVLLDGDCDDTNADINPAAIELCNGLDENCDGQSDEGLVTTFYFDGDGDGFGNSAMTVQACDAPTDYVAFGNDCDDTNADIGPGATEVCNGIDDNCDGLTDEGLLITFYLDADGDGFGAAAMSQLACSAPTGYVPNSDDCDDTNADINPGGTEICNGLDDNCDGATDEGVLNTFYLDSDGDGFGGSAMTASACDAPTGYVANSDDCDDNAASVYPGAAEICNSLDDNCDGQVDEGVLNTFYLDSDGDGFGSASATQQACDAPTDYVANADDCDDSSATIYPGATEIANNGIDEDCDGQDLMTGTDELAELNIQVYPNPFSDRIRLENLPATGYEVKLVNVFGQTIANAVATDNSQIACAALPAGTYFVQITEVSTARRKVVVVMKN
ncbi:MAG: T9SS type A sorting domain-containing protein [Bacteroidetes bacterium]|nr:T9SS type A sorting domain-containing protein [Bacteroidota bacterium]